MKTSWAWNLPTAGLILRGILGAILLVITARFRFVRLHKNQVLATADGRRFRVFRHLHIAGRRCSDATGRFLVRFRPTDMSEKANRWFSLIPMFVFVGFPGFVDKYWCFEPETGLFQGAYLWKSVADARAYQHSPAMQFMAKRSDPASVWSTVVDLTSEADPVLGILGSRKMDGRELPKESL